MFALLLMEDMNPFYQNIASFPTAIFTFLLVVCVLFWLIAMLGMIDLEGFDFGDATPDMETTTGHAMAGVFTHFNLREIPLTVTLTFFSLFGWLISYYSVHYLSGLVDGALRYPVGFGILLVGSYVAMWLTSLICIPLRPFFRSSDQNKTQSLIGQVAIVRTSKVDQTYGEAFINDDGAGLIIKIRSINDQVFLRDQRVVLIEYVEGEHIYRVISEDEFLGKPVI
jgi:hypothetical protein